jgi:hypothetical protein
MAEDDREAHGCRPFPASALSGTRAAGMTAVVGRVRERPARSELELGAGDVAEAVERVSA